MFDPATLVVKDEPCHSQPRGDFTKQKETSGIPFGRASQMVRRSPVIPVERSPIRPEIESFNELSPVQNNCGVQCFEKENCHGVNKDRKRNGVQMICSAGISAKTGSITQLPHPSQLRKKRKQYYGKTKPLGWDFMSHVQQLHRKKEEFESVTNSQINTVGFTAVKNPMYVRVVRNQLAIPPQTREDVPDVQEMQHRDRRAAATPYLPWIRERSFNLFPFSEE